MMKKLVAVAAVTIATTATVAALAADADGAERPFRTSGALQDLSPMTADVTDGGSATIVVIPYQSRTAVLMVVRGLDRGATGSRFGAHAHVGGCVAGDGAAAGPHYNAGGPASPSTEVWLDFTVLPGGVGLAHTLVPFVIPSGAARSVVIHAMPTDPTGAAGSRLACLPVAF